MGMNNVWYPFVEMAGDAELKTSSGPAADAGVRHARRRRQAPVRALCACGVSIVGKCHFCVQSHYALLKEGGMSVDQLRDVGRIAAVVAAAANAIEVERELAAA